MSAANDIFADAAYRAGRFPERITPSEWADRERWVSDGMSPDAGQWDTARFPYHREILDNMSVYSPVQQQWLMKGAQIGSTEIQNNLIGYFSTVAPSPGMIVHPTLGNVKKYARTKFAALCRDTPAVRKVMSARGKDGRSLTLERHFAGGFWILTGANSAADFRSTSVQNLLFDEMDEYPFDVEGQGDPVDLAMVRTRAFTETRKIFGGSTPTTSNESTIERLFLTTDQRYFELVCLHCDHRQPIFWPQIKWPSGKPREAVFLCRACDHAHVEADKTDLLESGIWIPSEPDLSVEWKRGYHLSSLYSPHGFYSWGDAAEEFVAATGNVPKLKVFVNTVCGEPFSHETETLEPDTLKQRREVYGAEVPDGVQVICAGVDVQGDRLEVQLDGFGYGEERWVLDYRKLFGDPRDPEVWIQLDNYLLGQFRKADGTKCRVRSACVDSGYLTDNVYDFCQTRALRKIFATKGVHGWGKPIVAPPTKRRKGGRSVKKVELFPIGVDEAKAYNYGRLSIETPGAGYVHFPLAQWCDDEYFKMLASEKLETQYRRGRRVKVWKKKQARNEILDLFNLSLAAYYLSSADHGDMTRRMNSSDEENSAEAKVARKKAAPRRSNYLN